MTPMQAIKAKCADCIYDPMDSGTRTMQIESCLDSACALYEYRPLTSATKKKNKEKRIKAMSPDEYSAYMVKSENARKNMQKIRGSK